MPERTEEQIVALVQNGDARPFQELIARYQPKLTRYAKRFLFDPDEAKDLLQIVFIKAYVNIKSFDVERRFSPWLYRVAHNEFVNALKKKLKDRDIVTSLAYVDIRFTHPVAKEDADGDSLRNESKKILKRSLDQLHPKYREPLILYYFDDLDYKGIASMLHIPISTVGVRLQRGKAQLRKIISPYKIK
jgi:RNA polymerase sigma-70 factor (ECF subfamily)